MIYLSYVTKNIVMTKEKTKTEEQAPADLPADESVKGAPFDEDLGKDPVGEEEDDLTAKKSSKRHSGGSKKKSKDEKNPPEKKFPSYYL